MGRNWFQCSRRSTYTIRAGERSVPLCTQHHKLAGNRGVVEQHIERPFPQRNGTRWLWLERNGRP